LLLFIIRVKRELKRVYRNGCRYNERLNTETDWSLFSYGFRSVIFHYFGPLMFSTDLKHLQDEEVRVYLPSIVGISLEDNTTLQRYLHLGD
jgi:hypothetical protein